MTMRHEAEGVTDELSFSGFESAPSTRVPVTRENRSYLRWLRAAEMLAWNSEADDAPRVNAPARQIAAALGRRVSFC